jgi:acyl dehydratase
MSSFGKSPQSSCAKEKNHAMPATPIALADIEQFEGRETGVSGWMAISQERIDAFAAATDDHQWIHKQQTAAYEGPFKSPIAHGLLVLATALRLAQEAAALPQSTWIICGYDKLRFPSPVRSGNSIRCRTTVLRAGKLGRRVLLTVRFTIEIQEQKAPALVGDCSLLCLDAGTQDS